MFGKAFEFHALIRIFFLNDHPIILVLLFITTKIESLSKNHSIDMNLHSQPSLNSRTFVSPRIPDEKFNRTI